MDVAAFNPHLQRVLKSFQSAAMDSLRGPSDFSSTWKGETKLSGAELEEYKRALVRAVAASKRDKSGDIVESVVPLSGQGPVFLPMDTSSEKSETMLEGEKIACFVVGGEKRLCLPQVLQTVLRKFSMDQVQEACSDLHIFLSRCNPEQLQILKMTGNLPPTAPSCGLMTKTDAERLCNKLLHSNPETYQQPNSPNSFKVYHECFGKCKGILIPELYTATDSKCIKCTDCNGIFNPQKFVGHSHKALENRTCHWGFDSDNWRSYLLLAKDQDCRDSLQSYLEDIKSRFDFAHSYKRKESPTGEKEHEGKKARLERYYDTSMPSNGDMGSSSSSSSAFRPWSPHLLKILNEGKQNGGEGDDGDGEMATKKEHDQSEQNNADVPAYLQKGPPKLLNPESVIPYDDEQRYERHFAPNVSLAPLPPKKRDKSELYIDSNKKNPLKLEVSDTDSVSTKSETSVPTTPNENNTRCRSQLPQADELSRWRDEKVNMFKQALAGTFDDHEQAVARFLALCSQTDDSVESLIRATKDLQLEACDAQAAHAHVLRQIEAAQKQSTCYENEIRRLKKEMDGMQQLRKQQLNELKSMYRCQLNNRETQYAEMHAEMLKELHCLREELRKGGCKIPDINYDFELMGECPKLASPPLSPSPVQEAAKGGKVSVKTEPLVKVEGNHDVR